jgi:predicted MFS family arabinose efflux permease
MTGMILGAFLWGWLGDRFGRLKALYGSILIYSIGTLACSFVHDTFPYGALRFITGFGLAGETGAAITLIAELMPPQKRGWGIIIISSFGFLGPVFAVLTSLFMPWRATYIAAGILGLLILALRMQLAEPELFRKIKHGNIRRGSLKILAQPRQAAILFCCIAAGWPMIYGWSLLNFFSMEFAHAMLKEGETFNQKICLLLFYLGTSCGDVMSGAISQLWRNRRKAMAASMLFGIGLTIAFLLAGPRVKLTAEAFYGVYFLIGISAGAWILFAMVSAEHFGTNVRATTTIITNNLVRGFSIPMIIAFQWFQDFMSITDAALLIGIALYLLAFFTLSRLDETHGTDLDYIETLK